MIYFIEAVGAGLVKIGFTERSVDDRLRELQTASPHRLRIAAALPGTLKDEADFHEQFAHLRECGEWFHIDAGLASLISFVWFAEKKYGQMHKQVRYCVEAVVGINERLMALEAAGGLSDDAEGELGELDGKVSDLFGMICKLDDGLSATGRPSIFAAPDQEARDGR